LVNDEDTPSRHHDDGEACFQPVCLTQLPLFDATTARVQVAASGKRLQKSMYQNLVYDFYCTSVSIERMLNSCQHRTVHACVAGHYHFDVAS
jgi:hypothetical protein